MTKGISFNLINAMHNALIIRVIGVGYIFYVLYLFHYSSKKWVKKRKQTVGYLKLNLFDFGNCFDEDDVIVQVFLYKQK
jgi:hypothetical protein